MFKENYVSAMDKLKFRENLKQDTIRIIRNKAIKSSLNWKYKFLIGIATIEVYFLSFGTLIAR